MEFKDLRIGDTFDFISPDKMMNSFYEKCTKVSARKYSYSYGQDKEYTIQVGSIYARVYHVNESDAC